MKDIKIDLKTIISCPMAAFRFGSKCSRTVVYAPLLNQIAPFERINLLNQEVKSRFVRGPSNKI